MAPPAFKLVARDIETDPAFMMLYYAIKHLEDGKINFAKVAEVMKLGTANAASKRYARLIKVQDDAQGTTTTATASTTTQTGMTKAKSTSKSGAKKKAQNGDGVGEEQPTPSKKQKVTKGKSPVKAESSIGDDEGAMDVEEASTIKEETSTIKEESTTVGLSDEDDA